MKRSVFKHATILYAIFILMIFIGFSCSNPSLDTGRSQTGMNESGSVTVRLGVPDSKRSVVPEGWTDSIASYELMLTGDQAMGPVLFTDEEVLLENLPLGHYNFSVSAFDGENLTLAAGSKFDVEVTAVEGLVVEVELIPVMGGNGSLNITYDWTAAGFDDGYITHVIAELTPVGGTGRSIPVTISDNGFVFDTELPSGTYEFSCELYADGRLVSSTVEEYRVFDGLDTDAVTDLAADAFENEPRSPARSDAGQDGLSVELSWVDSSDRETGYRIYRSDEGGEFRLIADTIPANTTTWTDGSVEPDTSYTYRIVAVNEFGESPASETAVVVAPLISSPTVVDETGIPVIIGEQSNRIPIADLLEGYRNLLNSADLRITAAGITGDIEAEVSLSGDYLTIDTGEIPYETEGTDLILEFTIHIVGEALDEAFTTTGTRILNLEAPEVEEISEDDLKAPVSAFIYDDRDELERKMQTYDPPDAEEIFESWGRVLGTETFSDGADAEASSSGRNDAADMATWWKLKNDGDGQYIEYSKNSVYAGFLSPDGQESDFFSLEATVSSKDNDDDVVGLIVAFVRDGDTNYVLEAARSQGAISGGTSLEPSQGWGLIVRRLSTGDGELGEVLWSRQIDVGGVSEDGWKGAASRILIQRQGDQVTVATTDWDDLDTYAAGSYINVNLTDIGELRRFRGARPFGYFVASQERSSFRDIVMDGGVIADKLFYIDPESGDSEVWWFDTVSRRWLPLSGADIQDALGYPLEVTNPDTGETYLIERKGFRRGSWSDWWRRWISWDNWDRGGRPRDRFDRDDD